MRRHVLGACILLLILAAPAAAHDGLDWHTNNFRDRHEKRHLRSPAHITEVAKDRARQIVGNFAHDFGWTRRVNGCLFGENIAYRIPALDKHRGAWAFRAFRDSPVHRDMMLGRWHRMGSAIHLESGGMWVAQLFVRGC